IGRIADKMGNARVLSIILLISAIPMISLTQMQVTSIPIVLGITTMFFITVGGRMIPAMAIVISTAEPAVRGVFMSLRAAVQQLASGLAAFTAGMIMIELPGGAFGHYDWVGYVAVGVSLTGLLLVRTIRGKF
ncbi:MAG: MFS transporter, partial [Bacteroidetes bacterium]|nr:MFS transporter [Bacteroidota bacterium]